MTAARDWFGTGPIAFGVRRYRPGDRDAIVKLWGSRFGCDPEAANEWLDEVESDYPTECFIASPTQDGRILGFGITTVTNEETIDNWLEEGYYGNVDLEADLSPRTAIMHIGVTRPECENQGIASALWRARLEYALEHDAERAVGTSWNREDHVDSSVLFEKYGFEPIKQVETYYEGGREDCPDCSGACKCDATIYWRELGGSR